MRSQSGNMLFIIFVAVVLFAALGFAFSSGSRNTGTNLSENQADLDAGVMRACSTSVKAAVNRLKANKGCKTSEISYELADGSNANADAPTNESCHLFRANGAGLEPCGSYLDVIPTVSVGNIAYGDTTTAAIFLPDVLIRCSQYGGQYSTYGQCENWEYSMDNGATFITDYICLAKDSAELTARGGQNIVAREFSRDFCISACGYQTSTTQGQFATSGSVSMYYKTDGTLEPYTGACVRMMKPIQDPFSIYCNCWETP